MSRPWRVERASRRRWGYGVVQTTREQAFVLAGCRVTNSEEAQRVWNVATGEEWSVGAGEHGRVRRLKEPK